VPPGLHKYKTPSSAAPTLHPSISFPRHIQLRRHQQSWESDYPGFDQVTVSSFVLPILLSLIRRMVTESRFWTNIFGFGGARGFLDRCCWTLTDYSRDKEWSIVIGFVHYYGVLGVLSKPFEIFRVSTVQKVVFDFMSGLVKCSHYPYSHSTEYVPLCIPLPSDTYRYLRAKSRLVTDKLVPHTSEIGLIVFGKMTDGVDIQATLPSVGKPQELTCSHRQLLHLTPNHSTSQPANLHGTKFSPPLVPPCYR
jgi:hypothetical protein